MASRGRDDVPRLRWSPEAPTEPGWYWFRQRDAENQWLQFVARIHQGKQSLLVQAHGSRFVMRDFLRHYPRTQWVGPLPEPSE